MAAAEPKKKKKKKKNKSTLLVVLLMVAGLAVMLYPTLSNVYNELTGSYAIQEFNENLANRIQNPNAQPVIYAIEASLKLNNDIAFSLRDILESQRIDFLESLSNAKEGFLSNIDEYLLTDEPGIQLWYERPFIESQMFANETSNLVYERAETTGLVRVHEQGNNRKDRYTSVSYGNYFISLLEQDLLSEEDELSSTVYAPCVSEIDF